MQAGNYWAETASRRECVCLDNKVLQLIYSPARRLGGGGLCVCVCRTFAFAVSPHVPMQ